MCMFNVWVVVVVFVWALLLVYGGCCVGGVFSVMMWLLSSVVSSCVGVVFVCGNVMLLL